MRWLGFSVEGDELGVFKGGRYREVRSRVNAGTVVDR